MSAQDIHFTQWMHAPHTYNPSEVGNINGDHRFHANFRNQWSSVTIPFRTFAFMADSRALTKNRNLGFGASIIHDSTGDSQFQTTGFSGTISYQFKLPKDVPGFFSVGIQPSATQKKLDLTKLNFDNQYNGLFFDPSLPINESLTRFSRWYFDLAVGLRSFLNINAKNSIEFGFSAYNLLKPKQSFYDNDDITLDRRYNGVIRLTHQLNKKVLLCPGILYSDQGTFFSYNMGMNVYYDISSSKYFKQKIFAGVYGRAVDSGSLIFGMIYGDWTAAVSYDINMSTLVPASNYRGGVEVGVIYVLRKPEAPPRYKSCPPYL